MFYIFCIPGITIVFVSSLYCMYHEITIYLPACLYIYISVILRANATKFGDSMSYYRKVGNISVKKKQISSESLGLKY